MIVYYYSRGYISDLTLAKSLQNSSKFQAIQIVESGERLERPDDCPDEIYQVMMDCWQYNPALRPTFTKLVDVFSRHPDYVNISQLALESDEV